MKKSLRFLSVLLTLTLALALFTPAAMAAGSPSDISGNWAKKYIDSGVKAGYISGYKDGTFRPNNTVTRGAFCKIVNQALGFEAMADISFSDVKPGDTFYTEIRKGVYAGYISGYNDGTFRPAATITRQQAAAMLSRILPGPTKAKELSTLKDQSSIAAYARPGVRAMISKGYLTANAKGNFLPAGAMTRAQTAASVGMALEGEKIVRGAVSFTSAGKTYANNLYVGPLTVNVPKGGAITFSNCRLMGTLTVKTGADVKLVDSSVAALSVNASAVPTVTVSGSTEVKNAFLSTAANLTEGSLSGSGFNAVAFNGSSLLSTPAVLRGAFTAANVLSPGSFTLASGSLMAMNVAAAAAGSTFALAAGTSVGTATLNAACAFTGSGIIAAAVQNASGITYQTQPISVTGTAAASTLVPTMTPANGAKNVAVTTAIQLKFPEALYNSSGKALTSSDITSRSVVELRRGSATGSTVSFSAALSSDRRTITLTPGDALRGDSIYYVIVLANGLRSVSGAYADRQVLSFTTGSSTLVPSVSPANGSTDAAITVRPTLTFSEAVYRASGSSLSSSYLRDSVVELRRGSESGTSISFTAELSSDKKTITVTPDASLSVDTKYYLLLNAKTLANSSGDTNTYQVFSFTTSASSLSAVMDPDNGKSGVSVSVNPTLTFSQAVYNNNGRDLTSSYLQDNLELRRGSESGTSVSFSASINSRSKVITIDPDRNLTEGTRYYVILPAKTLTNSNGDANSRQVFYFTTSGSSVLTAVMDPSDGRTGVSVSVNPTLTFDEAVYRSNGNSVSSSYLRDSAVELRRGSESGSLISFSASINSRSKVVTITPESKLAANTRYYLILLSGSLTNSGGNSNSRQVFTFTTGGQTAPSVYISSATSNVSVNRPAVSLQFSESVALSSPSRVGQYVSLYRGSVSGSPIDCTVSFSNSSRYLTITPNQALDYGSTYYVVVQGGYFYSTNDSSLTVDAARLSFSTENQQASLTVSTPTADFNSVSVSFVCGTAGNANITLSGGSDTQNRTVAVAAGAGAAASFTGLLPGTSYTVTVTPPAGSAVSKTISTRTPSITVSAVAASNATTAAVTAGADYAGILTLTSTGSAAFDTASFTLGTGGGSVSANLSGLTVGQPYTVTATLDCGSGKTFSQSTTVTAKSSNTDLKSLTAYSGNDSANTTGNSLTITVDSGSAVSFQAEAADNNARCSVSSSLPASITAEGTYDVVVTVTAQDGTTASHTVTVTVKVKAPTPASDPNASSSSSSSSSSTPAA